MKTYDKILFASDDDIQKRDRAIVELYDQLLKENKNNPIIKKYADFVKKTRTIYGILNEETEEA